MRKIPEYLLIVFNCLLAVVVLFESRLEVPAWLAVGGRLHPLILHLPIGLWAGVWVIYVLRNRLPEYRFLVKLFLQVTAVLTAVTALVGVLLAWGGDYEDVNAHQYAGVVLSGLLWVTAIYFEKIPTRLLPLPLVIITAVLLFTGHRGGELTHGEDFLSFSTGAEAVQKDDVYQALVVPILREKCSSCHNDRKTKGGLNLSSVAGMVQGGEGGPALVAGNALESHLMQRIFLPLEDKEHMPPRKKAQLTEAEIEVLTAWINLGAPEKLSFSQLPADSPLAQYRPAASEEEYNFSPADPAALAEVNTPFCRVSPLAVNSPALRASFFVQSRFDPKHFENLLLVKEQLVELNLSKMPVKDEDLEILSQFKNLRHLNLSGTQVTGKFLRYIKELPVMQSVALANTHLESPELELLARFRTVYLWESGLSAGDLARLQVLNPEIQLDTGQRETVRIPINLPRSSEKNAFLQQGTSIVLSHALPGVLIKYTLDGTVPDSVHGMDYSAPLAVQGRTRIKARAFKEGWLGSSVLELDYLVNGPEPDSAVLLTPPAAQYAGRGARSLYDRRKGDPDNFLDKTWLGYREKPLEAVFFFSSPRELKSMTVSMLEKADSYIMPPQSIEVWGKTASGKEVYIGKVSPEPLTGLRPRKTTYIDIPLAAQKYREIRIRVNNLSPLPAWHPGKGSPGWVFVDEVVFN